MGALKFFKKLDIKLRIALAYSVFLLFIGVAIVVFLSLALQISMKNQPVTSAGEAAKLIQEKVNIFLGE